MFSVASYCFSQSEQRYLQLYASSTQTAVPSLLCYHVTIRCNNRELITDGITQWHPAFLSLGTTLEICAAAYRKFCKRYQPSPKPERKNYWGSKLLAGLKIRSKPTKKKRPSPGQINLWQDWQPCIDEVHEVAKQFVLANSLNPELSAAKFADTT